MGGSVTNVCRRCGWPDNDVHEVLSRHLTSDGLVTYSRCVCGEVQIRLLPYDSAQVQRLGA